MISICMMTARQVTATNYINFTDHPHTWFLAPKSPWLQDFRRCHTCRKPRRSIAYCYAPTPHHVSHKLRSNCPSTIKQFDAFYAGFLAARPVSHSTAVIGSHSADTKQTIHASPVLLQRCTSSPYWADVISRCGPPRSSR